MKYIGRLATYLIIFMLTLTVGYVAALRCVPVTITPLKVVKLFENAEKEPFAVNSKWTATRNINMTVLRAVIATEDNFFLVHHGFDIVAIQKAIESNKRGRKLRGASTISQQTAKNVFCPPSRTWVRKGIETYFTVLIETLWGKRRIMEVYLNVIELGPNVYGVEAAARKYFKKDAADLNNYEAALIATVLPNPIRMKIGAPSGYVAGRAARVRALVRKMPPVDFDDPSETEKLYEAYKKTMRRKR